MECALKACIAKQTRRYDFPDKDRVNRSYTHKFSEIIKLLDMTKDLDAKIKSDALFEAHWETVVRWSEQSRYAKYSQADAQGLYDAISDPTHGVLQWLKQYW